MPERDVSGIVLRAIEMLAEAEPPADFDMLAALLELGATPSEAERLIDYIPAACGRAFLRELEIDVSDMFQRRNSDGTLGRPTRYADDPLWTTVESVVGRLRTESPASRRLFSIAARQSAEVDAISNALNSGKTFEDLRGGVFASVCVAPLRHGSIVAKRVTLFSRIWHALLSRFGQPTRRA